MNDEKKRIANSKALEVAFFLGALSMVEVLFRDEIDDPSMHRKYVVDLCESSAPALGSLEADELVISKLDSPARGWVSEWYSYRTSLS